MRNLFIILLTFSSTYLYSEVDNSSVKEEIIENTIDLSTEVIELNQKAIRNIASDDENVDQLDSSDVKFWFMNQDK